MEKLKRRLMGRWRILIVTIGSCWIVEKQNGRLDTVGGEIPTCTRKKLRTGTRKKLRTSPTTLSPTTRDAPSFTTLEVAWPRHQAGHAGRQRYWSARLEFQSVVCSAFWVASATSFIAAEQSRTAGRGRRCSSLSAKHSASRPFQYYIQMRIIRLFKT